MGGIRLEIDGFEDTLGTLRSAIEGLSSARPLFDEIGQQLAASSDQRFEAERGPDNNPWPASIRALAESGKTLTDTSNLRGSLTWEASDSGVAVGSNVIYAAIHQLGGTIKAKTARGLRFKIGENWITKSSVTIPARPFLGMDEGDEEMVGAAIAEHLGSLGLNVEHTS